MPPPVRRRIYLHESFITLIAPILMSWLQGLDYGTRRIGGH
jgi:hypothetical protein